MLDINILATGSKGNAYVISDQDRSILIDPGIVFKRLNSLSGFLIHKCELCIVSHEHKDHVASLPDIERLKIPIVISEKTFDACSGLSPYFNGVFAENGRQFEFNNWIILPFKVFHDAADPLGFIIRTPAGKKIVYATDTRILPYKFNNINYWMIEANYKESILGSNPNLPASLKNRIRKSHMEIETLKDFFRNQDLSATKKISLIHLSDDNSDEGYFKSEIEKITKTSVEVA